MGRNDCPLMLKFLMTNHLDVIKIDYQAQAVPLNGKVHLLEIDFLHIGVQEG